MASKTKKKKIQAANKKDNGFIPLTIAFISGSLALIQNRYGLFSDIREFYGMHFLDGLHSWPFSTHQLFGSGKELHPVEYPALTGLIMWIFTYFVDSTKNAIDVYFQITAFFNVLIFSLTTFAIHKFSNRTFALFFAFSPAVLYSLNRNWDIWAIFTLILAIYYLDKGKITKSSILLGISIATKFFPIVILLPIGIFYFRNKQFKTFVRYLMITSVTWLVINIPFMVIDLNGWFYFYKFSYERGLGSASIYEVLQILNINVMSSTLLFYLLNIIIFIAVFIFLLKVKIPLNASESSFFVLLAFILFNKQYSMQYVIWLTSLCVLTLYRLNLSKKILIYCFVLWQVSEFAFQFSFYQRNLTDIYIKNNAKLFPSVSTSTFLQLGIVRYLVVVVFSIYLASVMYKEKHDLANKSSTY